MIPTSPANGLYATSSKGMARWREGSLWNNVPNSDFVNPKQAYRNWANLLKTASISARASHSAMHLWGPNPNPRPSTLNFRCMSKTSGLGKKSSSRFPDWLEAIMPSPALMCYSIVSMPLTRHLCERYLLYHRSQHQPWRLAS